LRLRGSIDFTLSATPASAAVNPGDSVSYTVNQIALNGFTGTVNLSVTGLPAGATGSFNPTSISGSGSSTLALQTNRSTPSGSATLTFTGIDGSLTHSTPVTLAVNTPIVSPVITSPTTASGTVGAAFSYQITATNSPTSFGATGLPAGLSVNSGTGVISGT